jgi:hypothetical protein
MKQVGYPSPGDDRIGRCAALSVTEIPTLGEAGMVALLTLLAGAGMIATRRNAG